MWVCKAVALPWYIEALEHGFVYSKKSQIIQLPQVQLSFGTWLLSTARKRKWSVTFYNWLTLAAPSPPPPPPFLAAANPSRAQPSSTPPSPRRRQRRRVLPVPLPPRVRVLLSPNRHPPLCRACRASDMRRMVAVEASDAVDADENSS